MLLGQEYPAAFSFLRAMLGQCYGGLERYLVVSLQSLEIFVLTLTIAYFSPVHLEFPHLAGPQILLHRVLDLHRRPVGLQLLDEGRPQRVALFLVQIRVEQLDVYTRQNRVVEGTNAICREEKNAIVELESSEEAWRILVIRNPASRAVDCANEG